MIDLADNLVRHIGILNRYMMRALDAEMAPLGIGTGRFRYLFMLYIDDGLTQQEIAFRLQADKAAVARTLAQMEKQGFVERRRNSDDKRLTRVYLTDKSRHLRSHLELAVQRVIHQLTESLEPAHKTTVSLILQQMSNSLVTGYDVANTGK